jgi:hypothetical protein
MSASKTIKFVPKLTKHQLKEAVDSDIPETYDNKNGCHMLYQSWLHDIHILADLLTEVWPNLVIKDPVPGTTVLFITQSLNVTHWTSNGSIGLYGRAGLTKTNATTIVGGIIKSYNGHHPLHFYPVAPIIHKMPIEFEHRNNLILIEKAEAVIKMITTGQMPTKSPKKGKSVALDKTAEIALDEDHDDDEGDAPSDAASSSALQGQHPFHTISAARFFRTFSIRIANKHKTKTNWQHRLMMIVPIWHGLTEGIIHNLSQDDNMTWMHVYINKHHNYLTTKNNEITWLTKNAMKWHKSLKQDLIIFQNYYDNTPPSEHQSRTDIDELMSAKAADNSEIIKKLLARVEVLEAASKAQGSAISNYRPIPISDGSSQVQTNRLEQHYHKLIKRVEVIEKEYIDTQHINSINESIETIKDNLTEEIAKIDEKSTDAIEGVAARLRVLEIKDEDNVTTTEPQGNKRARISTISTTIVKREPKTKPFTTLTKDSDDNDISSESTDNVEQTTTTVTSKTLMLAVREKERHGKALYVVDNTAKNKMQSCIERFVALQEYPEEVEFFTDNACAEAAAGTFSLSHFTSKLHDRGHELHSADIDCASDLETAAKQIGEQGGYTFHHIKGGKRGKGGKGGRGGRGKGRGGK